MEKRSSFLDRDHKKQQGKVLAFFIKFDESEIVTVISSTN